MKKHIPNLFTLGNVFCGCVGIVQVFSGELVIASLCIGIAAIFDFLDGFVARILKVQSELGKQLDSLADAVTFGILPAVIAYKILSLVHQEVVLWHYIAFLLALFSVLRLAKFNIDTRQTSSFIGVPTPANAILWGVFPLIMMYQPNYKGWILQYEVLVPLIILMSYLLVAEIPLFALKFKDFSWKNNQIKFIFLILSLVLLILLTYLAIPLIIALYIILSVIHNLTKNEVHS